MQTFTAIIERDRDTGYYVGYVPQLPGAHSQGATIEELRANLVQVLTMLLEDPGLPIEVELIDCVAEQRGDGSRDRGLERLQQSSMTSVWSTPEDDAWNDVPITRFEEPT